MHLIIYQALVKSNTSNVRYNLNIIMENKITKWKQHQVALATQFFLFIGICLNFEVCRFTVMLISGQDQVTDTRDCKCHVAFCRLKFHSE